MFIFNYLLNNGENSWDFWRQTSEEPNETAVTSPTNSAKVYGSGSGSGSGSAGSAAASGSSLTTIGGSTHTVQVGAQAQQNSTQLTQEVVKPAFAAAASGLVGTATSESVSKLLAAGSVQTGIGVAVTAAATATATTASAGVTKTVPANSAAGSTQKLIPLAPKPETVNPSDPDDALTPDAINLVDPKTNKTLLMKAINDPIRFGKLLRIGGDPFQVRTQLISGVLYAYSPMHRISWYSQYASLVKIVQFVLEGDYKSRMTFLPSSANDPRINLDYIHGVILDYVGLDAEDISIASASPVVNKLVNLEPNNPPLLDLVNSISQNGPKPDSVKTATYLMNLGADPSQPFNYKREILTVYQYAERAIFKNQQSQVASNTSLKSVTHSGGRVVVIHRKEVQLPAPNKDVSVLKEILGIMKVVMISRNIPFSPYTPPANVASNSDAKASRVRTVVIKR